MTFDQAKSTEHLNCPICKGAVELVQYSQGVWEISCVQNSTYDEDHDEPVPCLFKGVRGATPALTLENFDVMDNLQSQAKTGAWGVNFLAWKASQARFDIK